MNPWKLESFEPTPDPVYLANGYLGMSVPWDAGVLPESTPPPGYLRGVYERSTEDGIDRLLPLPSWSGVRYAESARVVSYRRELDLRRGTLTTWLDLEEARGMVHLEHELFASRADRRLAAMRLVVRPEFVGELVLLAGPDTYGNSAFEALQPPARRAIPWMSARSVAYDVEVTSTVLWGGDDWSITAASPDSGATSFRFAATVQNGEQCVLTQLMRMSGPDDASVPDEDVLSGQDYERALRDHTGVWEAMWGTDIEIEGDPEVQQFVHAGLFYLWSTVQPNDRWSIAPMGLSGNGYLGHIFWDAEFWMYPSLLVTQPEMARSCVSYREHTVDAARERARENGYQGTQFPWEGAFTGEEMTPRWAETRDFQLHITADVAIGAWWYYLNTRDLSWLRDHGYPLMRQCADFWVSRVEPQADGERYHISDVVCADEYAEHVNNNAFTNAAVRIALLMTERAAELLGETVLPEWRRIADGLHIPYDDERQIHLEYDGFQGEVTKQADVELLAYPLEYTTETEQVARDLGFYGTVIDPDGPAMSFSVYSIVSAQLGRMDDAYRYLRRSFVPNCRQPFWSFSETPSNESYFFCTGVGGALQALLFGFTGLRLREDHFVLKPALPAQWQALRLRNLFVCGGRMDVEIEREGYTLRRNVDGSRVALAVRSGDSDGLHVEVVEGDEDATLRFDGVDAGKYLLLPAGGRVQVLQGGSTLLDVQLVPPEGARP